MATGIVDRLKIEITASTAGVSKGINSLVGDLGKLGGAMSNPKVKLFVMAMKAAAQSVKSLQSDIKNLSGYLGTLGSKAVTASKHLLGLNGSFSFLGKSANNVTSTFTTLASKIGLMYAALFPLMKLFNGIKELTGLAASLTEIQNVVDVTFGDMRNKVEEFTDTSIQQFGLAEISAKKFASQYQAMGTAMQITGGQVKNATQFLQNFNTMTGDTAGYDKASDSMADMSLNLTKLTADMASFYNVEQQTVANALQSGVMSGNTRPLNLVA